MPPESPYLPVVGQAVDCCVELWIQRGQNEHVLMIQETDKRTAKAKRLLNKVRGQGFSFGANQADLDLLCVIHNGGDAGAKPGDPSFHAYAAALNAANDFAKPALDMPELVSFNNELADIREEYLPSYPPLSPVTSALFAGWVVLDARDSITGLTLGDLFLHHIQPAPRFEGLRQAMVALNGSFCSLYEVMEAGVDGVKLWDIAAQRELRCWNSSGYPGRRGEVWYTRVLPPFAPGSNRCVTISTPYVFGEGSRRAWEDFFQRRRASKGGIGQGLQDYLKYGERLGYWLEFVFQAFVGYTGNMIQVTGIPDDSASLPHSDAKHRL